MAIFLTSSKNNKSKVQNNHYNLTVSCIDHQNRSILMKTKKWTQVGKKTPPKVKNHVKLKAGVAIVGMMIKTTITKIMVSIAILGEDSSVAIEKVTIMTINGVMGSRKNRTLTKIAI